MKPFVPGALFKRLAVSVGLALLLAIIAAILILRSLFASASLERVQLIHWNLAHELVTLAFEELGTDFTDEALDFYLHKAELVNPALDIYVLDAEGNIVLPTIESELPPFGEAPGAVPMAPIKEFLTPVPDRRLPLFGMDPFSRKDKVFSAAVLPLHGQRHYLYVILEGVREKNAATAVRERYTHVGAAVIIALLVSFTAMLGLVLYLLVTRRYYALMEVVKRIGGGDLSARYHDPREDEISFLGNSMNDMADKLVVALQRAQETDAIRRELVANVSHDLGGPLTALHGFLHRILEERTELLPETRKDLEAALKNIRMLTRLSSELLELSKLEAREKQPQPEPFPIAEYIEEELLPKYAGLAEESEVQLSFNTADPSLQVYADLPMIERVMQNLVENAIRYNRPGGTVTLETAAQNGKVQISVSDTGLGVPAEDVPRIFERFYRSNKARTKGKGGTGLGLAIVKQIIELHGETITVTSTVGEGTTFTFQMPTTP